MRLRCTFFFLKYNINNHQGFYLSEVSGDRWRRNFTTTVRLLLPSAAGEATTTATSSSSSSSIRRGPLVVHIACGMTNGTTSSAGDESAARLNRLPARVAPTSTVIGTWLSGARGEGGRVAAGRDERRRRHACDYGTFGGRMVYVKWKKKKTRKGYRSRCRINTVMVIKKCFSSKVRMIDNYGKYMYNVRIKVAIKLPRFRCIVWQIFLTASEDSRQAD